MPKQKQEWYPLFLEFIKFLRIKSKEVPSIDEKGAPLNLWSSQKKALKEIVSGMEDGVRAFIFLKSRQLGMTTITLAIDIFFLAYYPGTSGALVTENDENRDKFRETLGQYIDSFPKNFFGKGFRVLKDNDSFMSFSNGSRLDFIVAGRSKENWGEGGGYALVHMTEVSKYGKASGIASFRETLSQTNPNRLLIVESTAKGMNHYKRMWEEFKADKFTKKAVFLGWYYNDMNIIRKADPRFKVFGVAEPDPYERQLLEEVERLYDYKVSQEQLAWYRWKHADRSAREEDLHQNQPWTAEQAFVLTGHSYFQMAVLGKEYERCTSIEFAGYKYHMGNDFWGVVCEQIFDSNRLPEVTLRVWEPPDDEGWYVIGCDPAYGRGEFKNRHAISVWRVFADKMVQVAEYADNETGTRQCAWVLAHLAGAYKKCAINVEINGPGGVIITEMENLRERALLDPKFERINDKDANKSWDDFLMSAKWYLYKKPDHFSASGMKGVESTSKLKHQMMSQLRDKFVTEQLLIRSSPLLKEMMNVIQDGDAIGAVDPNTDDRVFAMAYAVRAWIDELAMPMMARGETYGLFLQEVEQGTVDKASRMMNNIINSFFMTREQEAENPPVSAQQQWLLDRGFI